MKKILVCILVALAVVVFITLIPRHNTIKQNFNYTCAISSSNLLDGTDYGTGVLLSNGFVITNRHVIDRNKNWALEDNEVTVGVTFFKSNAASIDSSRLLATTARVIDIDWENDLALLELENKISGGCKLISTSNFNLLDIGDKIYAIGCTAGLVPPTASYGLNSVSIEPNEHRASIAIYYGNSGGGLFLEDTGELIGITNRIRLDGQREYVPIPSMTEYIPANLVRDFAFTPYEWPTRSYLLYLKILSLLLVILVVCSLGYQFKKHLFC